jgi:hypothetical protein
MGDRSNRNFFGSIPGGSSPFPGAIFSGGFLHVNGPSSASAGVISAVANQVFASLMYVPFTITISKVTITIGTASAGGLYVVGLYDLNKNKLFQSSFSTTAIATLSNTLATPITITPGWYWYLYSADNNVAQTGFWLVTNTPQSNEWQQNTTRTGRITNTMAAGILPAFTTFAATTSSITIALFEAA